MSITSPVYLFHKITFPSNPEVRNSEEDELNININAGDAKVKFKGGIHIEDGDDVVHIGKKGIHVTSEDGESVHIGLDGIKVTTNDGKTYNKNDFVCNSNHHHSLKNTIESIFVPLTNNSAKSPHL